MSSCLVSNAHVNALASFAAAEGLHPAPEILAMALWEENRRSLRARYEQADALWPQLADLEARFRYAETPLPSLWHMLKATHAYRHQSRDDPAWEDSRARAVTDDILDHVLQRLGVSDRLQAWAMSSPSYVEAPWLI